MKSLYHYCSSETLIKIFKNKSLRLSDITKSNDKKEIIFLFDEYVKWSMKQNEKLSQNDLCVQSNHFFVNQQLENTTFFVSCFSENYDDLYMWSQYGDNGKGVFIEFDKEKLKDYLKHIRIGTSKEIRENNQYLSLEQADIKLEKIKYLDENKIDEFFTENDISPIGNFESFENLDKILKLCPIVKNNFFHQENEYRIFYIKLPQFSDGNPNKLINNLTYSDIDNKKLDVIPFSSQESNDFVHKMVLDIPIDLNLIKSITLGPNCKLTRKDILELFLIYSIEEKEIFESKGTLR